MSDLARKKGESDPQYLARLDPDRRLLHHAILEEVAEDIRRAERGER